MCPVASSIFDILHLQFIKNHIKAFSHSCRYGKYLSFSTLVTPITVLGAELIAFPC